MKLNTIAGGALLAASAALTGCGGGDDHQVNATTTPVVAPTPTAGALSLTVGQTVSRTTAEVAALANVSNFVPSSLTPTDGTYANCRYDAASNTLVVTPKVANTETPTDTCTTTFVDATGKTL